MENPFDNIPPLMEDDPQPSKSLSAGKTSAKEQGTNVPAGWKPTTAEPVPVIRCTATANSTGEQCGRWSLRGATTCVKHGAQLPNVREHSEAVVEAARMRLLGLVDDAIDGLEDLIAPGTQVQVRLGAIKEVLDRTGIKGGPDLSVEVSHTVSYKDEIAQRLKDIKERKAAMQKELTEVEDAEVVDEAPE